MTTAEGITFWVTTLVMAGMLAAVAISGQAEPLPSTTNLQVDAGNR